MAPFITTARNNSKKPAHIVTTPGGEGWALAFGETKNINDYITTGVYSEINVEEQDPNDSKGYRLKYSYPSQMISVNDKVGQSVGDADSTFRTFRDKTDIYIHMYENKVQIHCKNESLGLFQTDGSMQYYYCITLKIKEGGGVTLEGFEPRGGNTKDEVKEDKEASVEMKGQLAGNDGATESTSKTE